MIEDARARQRRHRILGAAVLAAVGVAALILGIGGGGGHGRQHPGPGFHSLARSTPPIRQRSSLPVIHVRGSATVCSLHSSPPEAGNPPPGQCVTIAPNGRRYQCPIGVENSFAASAVQAATSSACHRVAPPTIPAGWRPAIVRMNHVKACLEQAGVTVAGGPTPPSAQGAYPDTPIAALLIAGTNARPTTVSFYPSTVQARAAYRRTLPTVTRQAQSIAQHGRVLYTWNNQAAGQATTERGCVQTG